MGFEKNKIRRRKIAFVLRTDAEMLRMAKIKKVNYTFFFSEDPITLSASKKYSRKSD